MSIKVSVCCPIYGVERSIERCARSLFEQTMQDGIEFIFVNDCTKDRSIEILEQVLAEYPHRKEQTKIIQHKQNGGLVAARNTGLLHASGEYIIHCDSDDWVELDMYEKMYLAAKENDADMVYCDYVKEMPGGISTKRLGGSTLTAMDLQNELLNRLTLGTLCIRLYRKHIAQTDYSEFCPNHVSFGEDLLRNMFMLNHTNKIVKIPQEFYHYRDNPSSIVNSKKTYIAHNAWEMQDTFEKHFTDPIYRKALIHHFCWTLLYTMPFGIKPRQNFRKVLFSMLSDKHFNIKAKIRFFAACINYPLASYIIRKLKGTK